VNVTGNTVVNTVVVVAVVLGSLGAIAAATHVPPLSWLLRRLIGDPFADWLDELFEHRVRPMVRGEVAAGLADHMANEERVIEDVRQVTVDTNRKLDGLATTMADHVQEDRAAFAEVRDALGIRRDDPASVPSNRPPG
jgi:hypothetical protein